MPPVFTSEQLTTENCPYNIEHTWEGCVRLATVAPIGPQGPQGSPYCCSGCATGQKIRAQVGYQRPDRVVTLYPPR